MSVHGLWFLGVFLTAGVVCDLRTRRIPNALTVAAVLYGVIGHLCGWWIWHGGWMLLAAVPLLLAQMPMGDVKGMMVIGGIVGADVGLVLIGAMSVLVLLFGGYWLRWWAYPGALPFFPCIAGLTCGTVLHSWLYPI